MSDEQKTSEEEVVERPPIEKLRRTYARYSNSSAREMVKVCDYALGLENSVGRLEVLYADLECMRAAASHHAYVESQRAESAKARCEVLEKVCAAAECLVRPLCTIEPIGRMQLLLDALAEARKEGS